MYDEPGWVSNLLTSALSPERFGAARESGADFCLVDLEDSVPRDSKDQARTEAARFFEAPSPGPRLGIRINRLCDPAGMADVLAIRSYRRPPSLIMVPKVESPRDLEIIDRVVGERDDIGLIATIETAAGLLHAAAIAASSPRLVALAFGAADFALDVRCSREWEALFHARATLVVVARAAKLHVLDSPLFDDLHDTDRLVLETTRARDLGFSGKGAFHPRQVAVINAVFSPDHSTITAARQIVDAARSSADRICMVDGLMVGPPILGAARRTLHRVQDP